jgi:hypothetical protein
MMSNCIHYFSYHCEEHSDEAISGLVKDKMIASLRSQ